jgi:hypothetical protein
VFWREGSKFEWSKKPFQSAAILVLRDEEGCWEEGRKVANKFTLVGKSSFDNESADFILVIFIMSPPAYSEKSEPSGSGWLSTCCKLAEAFPINALPS